MADGTSNPPDLQDQETSVDLSQTVPSSEAGELKDKSDDNESLYDGIPSLQSTVGRTFESEP